MQLEYMISNSQVLSFPFQIPFLPCSAYALAWGNRARVRLAMGHYADAATDAEIALQLLACQDGRGALWARELLEAIHATSHEAVDLAAKFRGRLSAGELTSAKDFVCPLTWEVFRDPVFASDGFTYERTAIERWLDLGKNPVSPMSNLPLRHTYLMPNTLMRELCLSRSFPRNPNLEAFTQPRGRNPT